LHQLKPVVSDQSNSKLPSPVQLVWKINFDIIQHTDMARFSMDR